MTSAEETARAFLWGAWEHLHRARELFRGREFQSAHEAYLEALRLAGASRSASQELTGRGILHTEYIGGYQEAAESMALDHVQAYPLDCALRARSAA